jgi:hypothetical protein
MRIRNEFQPIWKDCILAAQHVPADIQQSALATVFFKSELVAICEAGNKGRLNE